MFRLQNAVGRLGLYRATICSTVSVDSLLNRSIDGDRAHSMREQKWWSRGELLGDRLIETAGHSLELHATYLTSDRARVFENCVRIHRANLSRLARGSAVPFVYR
jgi:hypothetical protein